MNLSEAAIVALGSNLGDSRTLIERALARLRALSPAPIAVSSTWETQPVDCPPGSPPFINAVAALIPRQGETASSLFARLQAIETELGRTRTGLVNEPRKIDLDLIAFRREICRSAALTIPHPRAHQRAFVLGPLGELDPDYVLPLQTETVSALLRRFEP